MGLRNGHFTLVNIYHWSQRHCNLLLLSFVVHCSITVDKVLEFCMIMCNIVLMLIFFSFCHSYLFYINHWRCQQSLISSECLSPGLTDHKDLKCSSQMWLRQQSTLHWGGTLWQDQSAWIGGVQLEPACSVQTLSHSDLWWHTSVLQPAVEVWQLRL